MTFNDEIDDDDYDDVDADDDVMCRINQLASITF